MKIAFQMESPADADREYSASLLLIQEACARGHEVFHYLPENLSLDHNDGIRAFAAPITVDLAKEPHYTLGTYGAVDLTEFDAVFLRQDPPFDMGYLSTTYILERLHRRGVYVSNDPFWVRNMPEKLSIFDFAEYLPPTLVTRDMREIEKFFSEHKDVVIKPLYSFHGHGIVRCSSAAQARKEIGAANDPLMFQPFLKEIYEGNKRIVLFDGEIAGALSTVLGQGEEFRIFRDSVDVAYEPSESEIAMCKKIGRVCKERGQAFVGIDLIGPYLTEINVTSTGSLARLNKIYGGKFEAKLWDVFEKKIWAHKIF